MRNVPSAIKWSVCITIMLVGDTCSRMLAHVRAHCTKGLASARIIARRSNVSVQALQRSSTLARTKNNASNRQSPLSSKACSIVPSLRGLRLRPGLTNVWKTSLTCLPCPEHRGKASQGEASSPAVLRERSLTGRAACAYPQTQPCRSRPWRSAR
jgi:hypothetical protein